MKKIFNIPKWLAIVLIGIFILRIPSFFEPYSYGDEMIYLSLGEAIRRGMILYKDIHDNKPPLLYFTAAIAGNLFWFRAILAIWIMATTTAFWHLTANIFPKNTRLVQIATIAFAILTTIPLLEGNIANAELFMIGFSIFGFLLLLKKNPSLPILFFGGVCFSLAALFKIPAAFDLPALFLFWILTYKYQKKLPIDLVKNIFIVCIGFLIPILFTFVWYFGRGAFSEYFIAAFAQNVGYLSSWRPDDVQKSFLEKNGPLLIRAGVVATGVFILWLARKKLSKGFILTSLWLLLSLFAVTLSERPYPHYLIQSVPALALLIGILAASTKMEQAYTVIPLAIAIFVPVYYKFYYYNTFSYYERFLKFATKQYTKEEYFNTFDGNVNRNYKIAKFLRSTTKENDFVFVWGDSPTIYALSQRFPPLKYVATYHINDFSSQPQVIDSLSTHPPQIVVILPESPAFPALASWLAKEYTPLMSIDGALLFRKMKATNLNLIIKNIQ